MRSWSRFVWRALLASLAVLGADPALAPGAHADELAARMGRSLFERSWVIAPASTRASDGLGPLFEARSCIACHGRRPPPPVLRLALADGRGLPHPVYGRQLQTRSIPTVPVEGRLALRFEAHAVTLADGSLVELRRPVPAVTALGYGELGEEAVGSLRVPPPLWGLGLLELVPPAVIMAVADPADTDADGISGRPNTVTGDDRRPALGRFGWKAGAASLARQNALAMALDIGLSSPLMPDPSGDCTPAQPVCRLAPAGAPDPASDFEASATVMDLLLSFTRALPAPPARIATDPAGVAHGRELFVAIGCGSCHRPGLVTAADADRPAQAVPAYTDLLLHDMGAGLADGLAEGDAAGAEWRTAPLWGAGLPRPQGHLHDGRARDLAEAILWHGGEAGPARDGFKGLPAADRSDLLRFLESL